MGLDRQQSGPPALHVRMLAQLSAVLASRADTAPSPPPSESVRNSFPQHAGKAAIMPRTSAIWVPRMTSNSLYHCLGLHREERTRLGQVAHDSIGHSHEAFSLSLGNRNDSHLRRAGCLHAGQRVLEDDALIGRNPELTSSL